MENTLTFCKGQIELFYSKQNMISLILTLICGVQLSMGKQNTTLNHHSVEV